MIPLALLLAAGLLLPASGGDRPAALDPPAAPGALAPNLTAAGDAVLLSWLEPTTPGAKPGEGEMALRYASFEGRRWSAPRTILTSPKLIANWADVPVLGRASAGWLVAGWPEKSGPGAYDSALELGRSEAAASQWKRIGPAHEDRGAGEHGFLSLVPDGDSVRAFWLDGRATSGGGSMSLRTTRIGERPEPSERLDARVCDCCQIAAAATSEGPLVVYRDRSEDEVRDIAVIRRDGGRWTAPRRIAADGWKIAGCPVNGPSAAAAGRDVAVAWFTGAADRPQVSLALSRDAGRTFGPPIAVDAAGPAGRVSLALDAHGDAIVAWVAVQGKDASIRLRRVAAGRAGPPISVASTTVARTSGFPRIARRGDEILVVWVEASDPFRLRAAAIPAGRLAGPPADPPGRALSR